VHTVIVIVTAVLTALFMNWLVMLLLREGVMGAHKPPYRADQRMTAAIHYGAAWGVLIFFGAIAIALRPLALAGTIARWPWCPPERVFVLAAAVLGGFGVIMWWFWLIRLGATAPARTRGRVIAFFALGAPLIVVLAVAAWWYGLDQAYDPLFGLLRLSF
jgi:hypothetical protein